MSQARANSDLREAVAHHQRGRLDAAIASYRRAVATNSRLADAHYGLGLCLQKRGVPADAAAAFATACALRPSWPDALFERARSLTALRRPAEALVCLQQVRALAPNRPGLDAALGMCLAKEERFEEARVALAAALEAADSAPVRYNLGCVLERLDRFEDALDCFQRVLKQRPDDPDSLVHCGLLLRALGDLDEAAANYERAATRQPENSAARLNLGLLRLTMGDFERGLPLYELRPGGAGRARPELAPERLWLGDEPLQGRSILLYAEQGLGDTIQFCRYVPLIAALADRTIVEVQPQLVTLLRSLETRATLRPAGTDREPTDYHCPLASLPLALGHRAADIPAPGRYVGADPARLAVWASRIAPLRRPVVGIAWQGSLEPERGALRGRSVPLAAFGPVASGPWATVALQKGPGREQLASLPFADRLLDLGAECDTGPDAFVDTAAILEQIDVLVTSDSAIAHVAGALGMPVWLALHHSSDWRWEHGTATSRWYPSMRLFRQRRPGDWNPVFREIRAALEDSAACGFSARARVPC